MSNDLRKYLKVALSLVISTVLVMFFIPTKTAFPYDYQIGDKWRYETLYSDVEFPILKTDVQIAADIENNAVGSIPCYQFDEEVARVSLERLHDADISAKSKADIKTAVENIYRAGILADNAAISQNQEVYIQRDKRIVRSPASDIFIASEAREKLSQLVSDEFLESKGLGGLIQPNLIFNSQLTEQMRDENAGASSFADGYVSVGEVIIRHGELITPELAQILNSYREEFNRHETRPSFAYMLIYAGFILMVLIILFLVVNIISPEYIGQSSFLYILTIFVIFTIAILLVARNDEYLLLMFPFTLLALLLQAFFPPKLVIPVYFVCLLPMTLMTYLGPSLYILFAIPGIVSIYLFKFFYKGWKQFLLALIIFAILALINFMSTLGSQSHVIDLTSERRYLYLFVGSFLTVAGYPLVYLFERIFNLLSNSRLIEISDTSGNLVRQLEAKAPGTLQHSLQVMNMSDYVARSIGANSLLLRAGALYHDLGKMNNPRCFVENESMLSGDSYNKYHASLSPVQSASHILAHVPEGVEIAEKHHLPGQVIDFIRSHHGTSLVKYFYVKHIEQGGSESDELLFRYQGIKPQTKEQVILMLCDSIEAASRTLKEHTPAAFENFVNGIVAGKMEEGQFEDADISIKELRVIKESLKSYLAQMYHERINYPEKKK